jgi:uncharacterized protein (TIGR00369 family)
MEINMTERRIGVASPLELAAESGLDFLRGMIDGRHPFPPFAAATDIETAEAEEGLVVFFGRPSERFFNPIGSIHGGWAATILDSAMGCAVHSTLKAGFGYTTVEMKLNYVRPIQPASGLCRCEGRIVHRGATIATSEGKLFDEKGRLLAHGTETCMIFPTREKAA